MSRELYCSCSDQLKTERGGGVCREFHVWVAKEVVAPVFQRIEPLQVP